MDNFTSEIERDVFFDEVREESLKVAKQFLADELADQFALRLTTEIFSRVFLKRQNYHGKIKFIDDVLIKGETMNDLKLEYNKILTDNNMHPYTDQQMKITEFVDKLIGMIGQVITEDGIVEVLESYHVIINPKYTYKQIASQILEDKGWEVVGKIKPDSLMTDFIFNSTKYLGKNIIVAIREVPCP